MAGPALFVAYMIATRIGRAIRAVPGVAYTIVLVGDEASRASNLGKVFERLADLRSRAQSQYQLMDRVRTEVLPRFAGEKLFDDLHTHFAPRSWLARLFGRRAGAVERSAESS